MADLLPLTGAEVIAGVLTDPSSTSYTAIDPSDGTALQPSYADSTPSAVEQSCQSAAEAFATNGGHTSAATELLIRWADLIESNREQIVARANQETRLGEVRLNGELTRTTTQMRFLAGLSNKIETIDPVLDSGNAETTPPLPALARMNQPIGPVAIFGASNFPLAFSTPGGDTASALAAGCPVVVKAHPAHPGTSELVARLAVDAIKDVGMHPGWFSMLNGTSYEVGLRLVSDENIQAVGFTGSLKGGMALHAAAANRERPVPVFAEMGSLNPTFVFPSSLTQETATAIAGALLLGTGQFCTKPGIIVVPDSCEGAKFTEQLGEAIAQGDPGTMLTPSMASGINGLLSETLKEDVQVVSQQAPTSTSAGMPAVLLETTLNAFLASAALKEEHFGPIGLIVKAEVHDFPKLFDAIKGSLTATLFSADSDETGLASTANVARLHSGRVLFNQVPTGVRVSPAMVHGGPYPATNASGSSSVGALAIKRFVRPVAYQNFPDALLPEALQASNPLGLMRQVDGDSTTAPPGI